MKRSDVMVLALILSVVRILPVTTHAAESTASAEKVVKEAQETIQAAKNYTAQQKEAFQRKAQVELETVQQQIAGLRAKVEKSSESARSDLQASINELQKKKESIKEKLDELKNTTDAKWDELREKMTGSLDELKQSYHTLRSRIP
ncbi:MAG: hypothetical protein AB7P24_01420 [Nitrospira sp.]